MAKQRRSRQSMKPSKVTVRVASVGGQPTVQKLVRPWQKSIIHRLQPRKTVKTLIKVDPTIGMTTKDAATVTRDASGNAIANGVLTPGSGGYKGATVFFKPRNLTPRQAKGTKVVKTPRPLGTGKIRNPFRGKAI